MNKPNRVRMKGICGSARAVGDNGCTRPQRSPEHFGTGQVALRQLAGKFDYWPNFIARRLVTGRVNLIGLVILDLMHSFFAEVTRALEEVIEQQGLCIVMANFEEDPTGEAILVDSHLTGRWMDWRLLRPARWSLQHASPFGRCGWAVGAD